MKINDGVIRIFLIIMWLDIINANTKFFIPLIILLCVHCYKVKKYNEYTYYKIICVPYFSAMYNNGNIC